MTGDSYHGIDIVDVVAAQLGRIPVIPFEVVVECPFHWPVVLHNSPFSLAGELNPNLFYLSCPYLRKELSRLEDRGVIKELQYKLLKDRRLKASLEDAQERHRRLWSQESGDKDNTGIDKPPAIGGSGDDSLIKCLHAHYAFYLAMGDYALGMAVEQLLPGPKCGDERCVKLVACRSKGR